MKVDKSVLLKALTTVKPGLASKEMIEQTTSFCFQNGKVYTYNDEISISQEVPGLELEGAVNALELYAYINKVKVKELLVEIEEGSLIIKAGRSKASIILNSEFLLPVEEVGEISTWKTLPDDFLKALSFAAPACSMASDKPILTCVHINKDQIEASDSYRIVRYKLKKKVPIKAFLLLAATCMKVIRMNPTQIASGKGWVHFKTKEDAVISCRVFEDKYPDVSRFITDTGEELTLPKNILDILDRASVFYKRDWSLDESASIHIEKNRIEITSESEGGSSFSEKARIDYTGKPIHFLITPSLLKDILKETTTGLLSESKLIFKGDVWDYLTLLK